MKTLKQIKDELRSLPEPTPEEVLKLKELCNRAKDKLPFMEFHGPKWWEFKEDFKESAPPEGPASE